jgi:Putative beta-barrel porin-2, OmpL-like. bbp2
VYHGAVHFHRTVRDTPVSVAVVIEEGVEKVSVVKWTIGLAMLAYYAAPAMAQQTSIQTAFNYNLEDEGQVVDAPVADGEVSSSGGYVDGAAYGSAGGACGCESGACESGCCESGYGGGCSLLGDCCLGDAWTLKDCVDPCCEHNFGGWFQMGYHSDNTGLSAQYNDLLDFNDVPDHVHLHQAWLYAEKVARACGCNADWGYRVDVVYGTDAQKTQAFGNSGGTWDVTFDNGEYGWAIPQAYAELAYGDWSVKVGHFFTPLGYEVIPATGNFFYSRSLTMFNSEPFTHTGVLGTYNGYDNVTLYAGWTLGWDTGFDQFDGGNNWLGGLTIECTDDISFTYLSTAGNFGFRSAGEDAYSHSIVVQAELSQCWKYVFQSDFVDAGGLYGDDDFENQDYGINQYLFYTASDCLAYGARMEWWKSDQLTGESTSFYEITGGINYRPHANVVVRPEIRYDWSPTEFDPDYNRGIFGIDAIVTF